LPEDRERERTMNVCIPVMDDQGLASRVNEHFGSTPMFVIVDTESGSCRAIPNRNQHHGHGGCQPLLAIAGESIDAAIVGGIGMGAMRKLQAAGVRVFISRQATVEEALAALKAGLLLEATADAACAHHGSGHHGHAAGGCGH
jgi:predicted Fe-Mo cluster-binding NifX family protein